MNIPLKTDQNISFLCSISFNDNPFIMTQLKVKTRFLTITDTTGQMLDFFTICP